MFMFTIHVPIVMWYCISHFSLDVVHIAAPKLWHSLPKDVCSCNNVGIFKELKSHDFSVAYNYR